jgi:HEAT repeat protein
MGLFDLLSKDKRDERARSKNIKQAVNKFAQSADRMRALESLAEDGSEEALYGLLRRFGLMYDKTIEDEQEKEWVFETMVQKGKAALPAVKRYLFSAESISWPLRILDKIAGSTDEELAVLAEVLERHEPGYERDPTKKIQLLNHLATLKHDRAAALCAPYLKDMDEGVRYAAVEALLRQKNEAVAREPLLELFTSDAEESLRLRRKIAEGFADLGWLVQGFRPGVEKKLPEAFGLDREGHIKRKNAT